jgi:hypothetical protein
VSAQGKKGKKGKKAVDHNERGSDWTEWRSLEEAKADIRAVAKFVPDACEGEPENPWYRMHHASYHSLLARLHAMMESFIDVPGSAWTEKLTQPEHNMLMDAREKAAGG